MRLELSAQETAPSGLGEGGGRQGRPASACCIYPRKARWNRAIACLPTEGRAGRRRAARHPLSGRMGSKQQGGWRMLNQKHASPTARGAVYEMNSERV